jgi:predicted  nucleic acid-binding Zn-ribbon protein
LGGNVKVLSETERLTMEVDQLGLENVELRETIDHLATRLRQLENYIKPHHPYEDKLDKYIKPYKHSYEEKRFLNEMEKFQEHLRQKELKWRK